jgi:predicted regulator of Ras-like GTPase activity (Roadblock/LC7/MglB family)
MSAMPKPGLDWQDAAMSSRGLGQFVLPTMEQLQQRIPKLATAVLCTSDGFNVCSLGVDENQVGKLAALAGSMLSVGNATLNELKSDLGEQSMEMLTLKAGEFQILGMKVHKPNGPLILMVAAPHTALGVMIVGAQVVAAEIEKLFGVH